MQQLSFHNVPDVEAFVKHVARNFCTRTGSRFQPADLEDLHAFLLLECWRLSEKFHATTPKASFKSHAYGILSFKCVDFLRDTRGRTRWQWKDGKTYERKLLEPLRLDTPIGDSSGDTLGSTLEAVDSDAATDLVPRGDIGLHIETDLSAVDDCAIIQAAAPREAPRRAAGPQRLIPRKAELETSATLRRLYPERAAELKLEPSE